MSRSKCSHTEWKSKIFFYPSLARNERAIKKNHQTQLLCFSFFIQHIFHCSIFPTHKQQKLLHPQFVEIFNRKHGWTKFSNNFAQIGTRRPGHCVHFSGCCAPSLSQKACSPLKICYLIIMFSTIRGAVTFFSHSIARMIYPPSKIIHNPKVCLFKGLKV